MQQKTAEAVSAAANCSHVSVPEQQASSSVIILYFAAMAGRKVEHVSSSEGKHDNCTITVIYIFNDRPAQCSTCSAYGEPRS